MTSPGYWRPCSSREHRAAKNVQWWRPEIQAKGRSDVEEAAEFYRNRTSTDEVAAFGSGMKKGIGRGQMKHSIVVVFETIKRKLINK